jgi:hypothetical protein
MASSTLAGTGVGLEFLFSSSFCLCPCLCLVLFRLSVWPACSSASAPHNRHSSFSSKLAPSVSLSLELPEGILIEVSRMIGLKSLPCVRLLLSEALPSLSGPAESLKSVLQHSEKSRLPLPFSDSEGDDWAFPTLTGFGSFHSPSSPASCLARPQTGLSWRPRPETEHVPSPGRLPTLLLLSSAPPSASEDEALLWQPCFSRSGMLETLEHRVEVPDFLQPPSCHRRSWPPAPSASA